MKVAVIGLGKLGLPLALVLADAGHDVLGYDTNTEWVRTIASGVSPIAEEGVQELLETVGDALVVDSVIGAEVRSVEMCFVIVPTPSVSTGRFTNRFVLEAVTEVGEKFKKARGRPVVVIVSTVMPGSTAGVIAESLAAASGRVVGESIGLCYSPEFIALGSVVRDLRNPDMVLIGESDPRSGNELEEVLSSVVGDDLPYHHMSVVDAEIAKIAVNTYVTMKISFANVLAEVCEGLPGADAWQVATAVGDDSRIGRRYLQPATAYGGPCFPRDTVAFASLADEVHASADLAEATRRVNRNQVLRLADLVRTLLPEGGRVGILGLSYKTMTPITEGSAGVGLLAELVCGPDQWADVLVYDPVANVETQFPDTKHATSAQQVADLSDLLVIATPWPEFAELAYVGQVIDCWNIGPATPNVMKIGIGR